MNFRRILLASGSHHLLKRASASASASAGFVGNSHRACTSVASLGVKADPSDGRWKKRKIFEKLGNGAVEETLNEETASVTEADLFRWAKRLDKQGKHQHALEMFEWMERKKITFSPIQLATYVELIGKAKGYEAANDYFYKVDPTFDPTARIRGKNWPSFQKLEELAESHPPATCRVTFRCLVLNKALLSGFSFV